MKKFKKFKNKREMRPFIIKSKHKVTDFEAALNNHLYKQINPNLKDIHEGDIIDAVEEPLGYFTHKGKKYAIYDDDPGQQVYTYIDGETFCGGSYTPIEIAIQEFCYIINNKRKNR